MLRVRFYTDAEDYRPINWPLKYPYWLTGEIATEPITFIIVAYADDLEYIKENWPEATNIESQEVQKIEFSDRFPKPAWFAKTQ